MVDEIRITELEEQATYAAALAAGEVSGIPIHMQIRIQEQAEVLKAEETSALGKIELLKQQGLVQEQIALAEERVALPGYTVDEAALGRVREQVLEQAPLIEALTSKRLSPYIALTGEGSGSIDVGRALSGGITPEELEALGVPKEDIVGLQGKVGKPSRVPSSTESLRQLSEYKTPKGYDIARAIRGGKIELVRAAGFDPLEIVDIQSSIAGESVTRTYTESVEPYIIEKGYPGHRVRELDIVSAVSAGITLSTLESAGYNISKGEYDKVLTYTKVQPYLDIKGSITPYGLSLAMEKERLTVRQLKDVGFDEGITEKASEYLSQPPPYNVFLVEYERTHPKSKVGYWEQLRSGSIDVGEVDWKVAAQKVYDEKYGGWTGAGARGRQLGAQLFAPARVFEPTVKFSEIRGTEWALGAGQLALYTLPAWGPRVAGAISPALSKVPLLGRLAPKAPIIGPQTVSYAPLTRGMYRGAMPISGRATGLPVRGVGQISALEGKLYEAPLGLVREGPVTLRALKGYKPTGKYRVYGEMEVPSIRMGPFERYTYKKPLLSGDVSRPSIYLGRASTVAPTWDPSIGGFRGLPTAPPIVPTGVGSGTAVLPSTRTMTPEQVARLMGYAPVAAVSLRGVPEAGKARPVPLVTPITPVIPKISPIVRPSYVPESFPGGYPAPKGITMPGLGAVPTPSPAPYPYTQPYPTPGLEPTPILTPEPVAISTPVTPIVTTKVVPSRPPGGFASSLFDFPSLGRVRGFAGRGSKRPSYIPRSIWEITGQPVYGPSPITGKVVGGLAGRGRVKYGAVVTRTKAKAGIKESRIDGGEVGQSQKTYKATVAY